MSLWSPPPPDATAKLAQLRLDYPHRPLVGDALPADPRSAFSQWLEFATDSGVPEPNAMVLSTVDEAGWPSSRTVLLKGLTNQGFRFFTNYQSRKGRALASNPRGSLLFPWIALHRQVGVVGEVRVIPDAESDAYFAERPRDSQLAAWASPQSSRLADRAELDGAWKQVAERFSSGSVPRPPHWGGFEVCPTVVEFWQGQPSRMHDRLLFVSRSGRPADLGDPEQWDLQRWAP